MTSDNHEILADYKTRLNQVFHHIASNLHTDFSLVTLSEIACFSPFHFHRIFKFLTGETLKQYVLRQKLEKAALDLLHQNNSVSEIAYRYGFSENSAFTRSFKKFYKVSPTEFKNENPQRFSKIRQLQSKNGQEYPDYEQYLCKIDNLKKKIKMNANIEITEQRKMHLAGVNCIGPQNLPAAYGKIIQWAAPKGLMNENTKMVNIYHDSFKVTEADKVRISACILLNEQMPATGELENITIEKGKFIKAGFQIGQKEFEESWTGLFLWMNEQGYKKADRNPFEVYHNNPEEHPEKKAIVDFYIPIE